MDVFAFMDAHPRYLEEDESQAPEIEEKEETKEIA